MAEYKGESLTKEEWEKQQQAAPVNAITGKPFGQASEEAVQSKAQEFRQDNPAVPGTTAPPDTRSGLEQGLDWLKTPAGTAAVGAAGLLAGYGIAGLKSRRLSQQRTPARVEPTFADGGFPPPPPPPPPPPAAAPVDRNAQAAQRLAEFESLAAKLGGAPVPAPVSAPVPAPAAPAPQPATVLVANPNRTSPWDPAQIEVPNPAVVPAVPSAAEVAANPAANGSQIADATVREQLVTAEPETAKPAAPAAGAVEPPARTGSGQPAFPGTGAERTRMPKGGTFASAAEVPASLAFVPNAQYYDSLANAARSRTAAQEIVRAKGGYPTSDAQAREWAADFLKESGAPTRESMLAAGKKPDTVTSIFKQIGANKSKLAKMGGVAGALVAVSDLANAKTSQEQMEAGLNLLGAVAPPGLDVLPAGAPGVPQQQINAAALLGSPYAQTEWAQLQRLRARPAAGRGLAIPPIPQTARR